MMTKPLYNKQPASIFEQMDILEAKGMTIANRDFAHQALSTIGYYRFTGYAYTFRNTSDNSSYLDGTSFEQVMSLYEFDRELRHVLFGYIERIEVAFRARVIDTMSLGYEKLLRSIIADDKLESDIKELFGKYPFADKRKATYLGFPDDWHMDNGVWHN